MNPAGGAGIEASEFEGLGVQRYFRLIFARHHDLRIRSGHDGGCI
jgi:hypothetical protein